MVSHTLSHYLYLEHLDYYTRLDGLEPSSRSRMDGLEWSGDHSVRVSLALATSNQ